MVPTTPAVSVVMPAHNAGRTIGQAIQSVLGQTSQDFELVVCNDASTDDTAAIALAFDDPRIKVIANPENLGEGQSRDRAIDAAKGRWITMLDADDAYAPQRLEKLLAVAREHPGAVVFDEITDCHDTPTGLVPWQTVRKAGVFASIAGQPRSVDIADWISAPRTLIKPFTPVELIRTFHIRHPTVHFGADLGFMLSLLAQSHAPLWYAAEPLYMYRLGAGSMSTARDRYTLLTLVLDGSVSQFAWNPTMQAAIRRKAATTRERATYQQFFSALMCGQLVVACRSALTHPWVVPEFCRRGAERIPYHISRLRHSGAHRQTT